MPLEITKVPRLPERPPTAHKGSAGRVAIVAGSRGMSGAAALAGLGALRAGAGLVRVCTAASAADLVSAVEPSLMVRGWAANARGQLSNKHWSEAAWNEAAEWSDVLAVGPGMGRIRATVRALRSALDGPAARRPVVLDADALTTDATVLLELLRGRERAPTIVTPHAGEFAKMVVPVAETREGSLAELVRQSSDDAARIIAAQHYAQASGAIVVLKGHRTVVASAERYFVNGTGNAGMATGGMGDVLTGVIAALTAQGLEAFEAACLGVVVHGLAADMVAARFSPLGYLAREVASFVPLALGGYYGPEMIGI